MSNSKYTKPFSIVTKDHTLFIQGKGIRSAAIYSIDGTLLKYRSLSPFASTSIIPINLHTGHYIAQLQTRQGRVHQKIMVYK